VTGGNVTGGSVTGGSVTGGSVKGGDVKGGDVKGGTVTGGTVTPGSVTSGTVTAGTVGAATATSTVDGREITATTKGSVSINADGSSAVVTLGTHKLTVEKERLLLDGKERAKIPLHAGKILIDLADGRLSVRADGKDVVSMSLPERR